MTLEGYRYMLSRQLSESSNKILTVCMLNPSTADETVDDPTIASVSRLAKNSGFGKIQVLNLFAIRATDPMDLWLHQFPTGRDNWKTWCKILQEMNPEQDVISLAWGRAPTTKSHTLKFIKNTQQAASYLKTWQGEVMTWIINKDGSPRHPLYIPGNTKLQSYNVNIYLQSLALLTTKSGANKP
jgi:hypothetical protein